MTDRKPITDADHGTCADVLRATARVDAGVDVVVSTAPPIVEGPYTSDPFICPHGVPFWIEPTGEQIAKYVRDQTP